MGRIALRLRHPEQAWRPVTRASSLCGRMVGTLFSGWLADSSATAALEMWICRSCRHRTPSSIIYGGFTTTLLCRPIKSKCRRSRRLLVGPRLCSDPTSRSCRRSIPLRDFEDVVLQQKSCAASSVRMRSGFSLRGSPVSFDGEAWSRQCRLAGCRRNPTGSLGSPATAA